MNNLKGVNRSDIKEKEKKSLYSDEKGFDRKNKLNRSNKVVPKEILEQIEKGITIEELEDSKLPVFKYKTQITIHGIFGELTKQRIGGYKSLFQNKNLSIGVKWNAIDYEKKKLIYDVMAQQGFSIDYSSNDYLAFRWVMYDDKVLEKLKSVYDKIDDSLFIGNKDLFVSNVPWIGKMIGLDVRIQSIRQKDVWTFLENSFGMTKSAWGEVMKERNQARKKRDAEWAKRREENEREEGEKFSNQVEEYKEKYKVVTFEDIPSEDCIMSILKKVSFRNEWLIKKYTDKYGKAKYQVMPVGEYSFEKGSSKDEINTRMRKHDKTEEYVQKIMSQNTAFILKTFEGTGPKKVVKSSMSKSKQSSSVPSDLNLVDYSDKAIALFGNTKHLYEYLKRIGRWNRFLVNPQTDKKEGGWIFSKSKKDAVENIMKSF